MKRLNSCQVGCITMILLIIGLYIRVVYYEKHFWAGLYYAIIEPKDIKEPLVREEFPFYKKGFERIYTIKPKYSGYYNIFISLINFDIGCDKIFDKCKGEIIIEYRNRSNILKIEKKNEFICYGLYRNYGNLISLIRLDIFPYYNNIFRKDIDSIKIRINKPITCFPKGKDIKTYLVIRYTYNL